MMVANRGRGHLNCYQHDFATNSLPHLVARLNFAKNSNDGSVPDNMVFMLGHGFVVGASFGLPRSFAPLSRIALLRSGQQWTPPLWQRGFFLVYCFVLRRFLTSERTGVVKTFGYPLQADP